ncbi:MAG: hypothetical protein M3R50_08255 [Bacteroidota bacterium]|nr:hypothetical protein [Bacteroidota bacterium]
MREFEATTKRMTFVINNQAGKLMKRMQTPLALRMLLQSGKEIRPCPVCKEARMELAKHLSIIMAAW